MRRRRPADRGSTAVEFALVVPLLVVLVFGIVDYGLFFSNTLGARSGVREAARQAVVENFAAGNCAGLNSGGNANLRRVACLAVRQSTIATGDTYARVTAPNGWDLGDDVLVCVVATEEGVTGLTPLPAGGQVRASLRMRIEQEDVNPSGNGRASNDSSTTTPPGGWTWCV